MGEILRRCDGVRNILTFDDKDISTEYSALMSKVMSNGNGFVKFPINEPAEGKKKSQVEEYLEFYNGEGVQHVAIATKDIVKTVTEIQKRGVEFLNIPSTYYDELPDRVGHIDEDLEPLKRLGILVDRDNEGYLLQIFTKPVEDRPTLFSKSFSAKAPRVSAKVISKRSSRRSRKSRTGEAICNQCCHVERSRNISNYSLGLASLANVERSFDSAQDDNLKEGRHAVLSKARTDSAETSHLVSSQRRRADVQNEGIAYEHVITTEGFNEAFSIMYHLRPPTRVRSVKLLKCEELKKAADSPLRHHHLRTANIPRRGDLPRRPYRFFLIRT